MISGLGFGVSGGIFNLSNNYVMTCAISHHVNEGFDGGVLFGEDGEPQIEDAIATLKADVVTRYQEKLIGEQNFMISLKNAYTSLLADYRENYNTYVGILKNDIEGLSKLISSSYAKTETNCTSAATKIKQFDSEFSKLAKELDAVATSKGVADIEDQLRKGGLMYGYISVLTKINAIETEGGAALTEPGTLKTKSNKDLYIKKGDGGYMLLLSQLSSKEFLTLRLVTCMSI